MATQPRFFSLTRCPVCGIRNARVALNGTVAYHLLRRPGPPMPPTLCAGTGAALLQEERTAT